jgi:hypothetical protein
MRPSKNITTKEEAEFAIRRVVEWNSQHDYAGHGHPGPLLDGACGHYTTPSTLILKVL